MNSGRQHIDCKYFKVFFLKLLSDTDILFFLDKLYDGLILNDDDNDNELTLLYKLFGRLLEHLS